MRSIYLSNAQRPISDRCYMWLLILSLCVFIYSHRFHAPFVVGSISVLLSFTLLYLSRFNAFSLFLPYWINILLQFFSPLSHSSRKFCCLRLVFCIFDWPELTIAMITFVRHSFLVAFQNKYHTSMVPIIYYVNHSITLFFIAHYYLLHTMREMCVSVRNVFFSFTIWSLFSWAIFSTLWCVVMKCLKLTSNDARVSENARAWT